LSPSWIVSGRGWTVRPKAGASKLLLLPNQACRGQRRQQHRRREQRPQPILVHERHERPQNSSRRRRSAT
jgi:hypothetical protein